jgi:outer membrane protein OmpA-like peptidoglycan-associated protein
MDSHRVRTVIALFASIFVAAILRVFLIDAGALQTSDSHLLGDLGHSLLDAFAYGLPPVALAVAAVEVLRVRRLDVQIAVGTVLTFVAAHLSTRSEELTSRVFSGGALLVLALLAVGLGASTTYWAIAGRRAGWRGDGQESEAQRVSVAFERASERAKIEHCRTCLVAWSAGATAVSLLLAWILVDGSGLRGRLLTDAQLQGQSVLRDAGYGWATFSILEDRGVIDGVAPDELEKRAAYDAIREALSSITGFPGYITKIDDRASVRFSMASVAEKLAEVARREEDAKKVADEARRAAELARIAADEIKREAAEQAAAAEAKLKAKIEGEGRAATVEPPSEAHQVQSPNTEPAMADPDSRDATADSAGAVAPPAEPPKEVPAVQSPTTELAMADPDYRDANADATRAIAPTPDEVGASARDVEALGNCADQDVALVETSSILFEPQSFEIPQTYANELDRVAASVRACAPRPIQVSGHADSNADSLFNPALALQRAEAVRDALKARDVAATRIVIKAEAPGLISSVGAATPERAAFRRAAFALLEKSALSRDATQGPDERANNCENDLTAIMVRSIIHFPVASAKISPESMGLIIRLANAIRACGTVIVTIEGHTDRSGTSARNQQLSEARANSVREALVVIGVDPTRLASRGFAASRPYDAGESAEAYALNRRIEFRVTSKFASTTAGGL